ncbi:sigma factor-like helix-turn-helix DNA-binding protein [Amycolatopsis nalaikhensis]|uniref:RNA polymerase sigma factor 70 region 4 type 2 domain-containing protein n=1 Tax=Amycolatopsis nalaikhensis TaxID=715472 RepID=A0ABY8XYF8_9PSEU|nr:sigma factor-like helix-turn-helix DNA-binding protein [Amycolatopsis sp. 2-2]WIV60740.1 hypothetical protein QP939_20055 [Amycolatopsis sp. 2-2]
MARIRQRYTEQRSAGLGDLLEAAQAAGVYSKKRKTPAGDRMYTPQAQRLFEELWTYSYPVLKAQLGVDAGFTAALRVVRGMPYVSDEAREAIMETEYHRDDLAADMILTALPRFFGKVIERREWDSTKSKLTTFFVNACWLAYPEVLKRWLKERTELTGTVDDSSVKTVKAVDLQVPNQELVRMIVLKADHTRVRPILALLWEGYTIAEAAEKLELNPSTVRSRLFEFRKKKLLPQIAQGNIFPPRGHALQSPYPDPFDTEPDWEPDWSAFDIEDLA